MIEPNNYFCVQGWMVTELQLKGTERDVFAIIYGFSQTVGQAYTGNLQYLADWCGCTKQSVITHLKSLVDKGYLIKEEKFTNGLKFCTYSVNVKVLTGIQKILTGYSKNLNGGIQKILPNNITNNIKNNINLDTPPSKKGKTKKDQHLDKILAKMCEYDFSEVVQKKILDYFSDRLDNKDYPQDNQLTAQFDGLSKVTEREQLEAISNAIAGGWKSMLYSLDKRRSYSNNGFKETAKDEYYTQEEVDTMTTRAVFK